MNFTICVTVYCEHEPTFVFTLVLSLLLVVFILVWFYLHLRDFIPTQHDLPSLACVSHYMQCDCVYNCAANLIEEPRSIYFYSNSLSRYTSFLPKSTCPFGKYNVDRNNAYDYLVMLSSIFMYMEFFETSQWSALMQWPT